MVREGFDGGAGRRGARGGGGGHEKSEENAIGDAESTICVEWHV